MKCLYHVMKNKINNKYKCYDTMEYDPKFDGKFS